jgi:hypothetical protein
VDEQLARKKKGKRKRKRTGASSPHADGSTARAPVDGVSPILWLAVVAVSAGALWLVCR